MINKRIWADLWADLHISCLFTSALKKVCNFKVFNENTFVILSFLGINNSAYLRIQASTKT